MQQGQVRVRPQGKSQAHNGVQPLSPLTTATPFEPLPTPLGTPPYHYDLETPLPGITESAGELGKLVFHVVGDTGGVRQPQIQDSVAAVMVSDLSLTGGAAPSFFYHLGDVVYFNGQLQDYYAQFYEPYTHYTPPIIAIPGNHDGDPIDSTQVSLDGWVAYFMTATPHVDPSSHDAPRVTMSLPNVYFTLNCPFVTIVGMYTNVPEGGSIDSVQQQWLTNELATAPADKALIVALHHPLYSFDDYHSGSPAMADAIQQAVNDSRRVPNMVLTAHVHNYQRVERPVIPGAVTPFIVAGLGGYYNLHLLNADVGTTDPTTQATLVAGNDQDHGYMTLTVDADTISGTVTTVPTVTSTGSSSSATDRHKKHKKPHSAGTQVDTFSYPAAAQYLADGVTVSL